MPGREDLIKENNARASAAAATANTPQPQEAQGKAASSSLGGPRNLFGGNIDVFSALEKVQFQGASGDGSLRGNVAYIRLWKRGGSAQSQQPASTQQAVQAPDSDSQQILQKELDAARGTRDKVSNSFNPATQKFSYEPYGEVDNPIEVAEANVQIAENKIEEARQKAISAQTPTSSEKPSATAAQVPPKTKTSTSTPAALGPVKSANPNGFLNTLVNSGKAALGLSKEKPKYSGKITSGEVGASGSAPGEMMWQFLFNPSELELEVGPEFKNAEVWGVSDKGNSGQPLHWSHNKNAQLKFNSVLLNGFVFGRKVEELEQGLIELFMARDGDGQHGPHVLEFVWGKRVFGPCVMKGINIKEKMWDEGEVVNAEVSFTLEQVPEWTINDGFVDVARPGRQQLVENPVAGAAGATDTTGIAPAVETKGEGEDQKSQSQAGLTPTELYKKCQRAKTYSDQFGAIESNPTVDNRPGAIKLRTSYSVLYPQAVNELGSSFTNLIKEPLADPTQLYKSTELALTAEDKKVFLKNYGAVGAFIKKAAKSARLATKTFSESAQCKAEEDRVGKATQQQKQKALCNAKKLGSSCATAGIGEGQTINTCSGIRLICARGYLKDPSLVKL